MKIGVNVILYDKILRRKEIFETNFNSSLYQISKFEVHFFKNEYLRGILIDFVYTEENINYQQFKCNIRQKRKNNNIFSKKSKKKQID